MSLNRDVFIPYLSRWLSPHHAAIPIVLASVLERWKTAKFERQACFSILADLVDREPILRNLFQPDRILTGEVPATDALLRPAIDDADNWWLVFDFRRVSGQQPFQFRKLHRSECKAFGAALRAAALGREANHSRLEFVPADLAALMIPSGREIGCSWPDITEPGIYRREHATLLIRSATTSVLIDPIPFVGMPNMTRAPRRFAEDLDAILITHGHMDHWNPPSIVSSAQNSTRVVVPKVPHCSILCPDNFEDTLVTVGVDVVAPEWGDILTVGDIEIEVLPFFGEQPTRESPGPAGDIRNWGNCYRIDTPFFSAVVLADAGADPAGSIVEAVSQSVQRRGPIDIVLSSTRVFDSPFFSGIQTECFTIPFSRAEELFVLRREGRLPSTTLGPEGVVEVCAAADAQCFLPYANGFSGVGQPIVDIGWPEELGDATGEPAERETTKRIRELCNRFNLPTIVLDWTVGDRAVMGKAGAAIETFYRPNR